MRYFRHTIAEHPCSKHCGYKRSDVEVNMSPFHFLVALMASVLLEVLCIYKGIEWYYWVSILAGELLLVFVAGFLSMFLMISVTVARQVKSCPKCGAPLAFAGRHFDPLGSQRPHWTDMVIFAVFIVLNVGVWISLV